MSLSRRSFTSRTLAWAAGAVALSAGLVTWGLWRPDVPRLGSTCAGRVDVKRKILVAYATRAGSTAEVARTVGERLCAAGLKAEVKPVERGLSVHGCDAVVLGSCIRYGAWLGEMTGFVAAQRDALARLPLAIFTLHMQALGDDAASRATRARYTQPVRALVNPRHEAFFAGRIDPATLSFFERMAVKMVKSPVGDRRDWAAVQAWADGLAVRLQPPAS